MSAVAETELYWNYGKSQLARRENNQNKHTHEV